MNSNNLLDFLRALLALPAAAFWPMVAALLDAARQLGGVTAGLLALGLLALPVAFAFFLQDRLNRLLAQDPSRHLGGFEYLRLEFWCSLLALPVWPLRLLAMLWGRIALLARSVSSRARDRRQAKPEGQPGPAAKPASTAEPEQPHAPLLVASLGPGFLLAGMITVSLYLVARLLAPFLRAELGLSPGLSAWQYIFLGRQPELAWYLPLDRFPFLGALLSLILWIVVWSLSGITLRWLWYRQLGRNLAAERGESSILPVWGRWLGTPSLAAPDSSYLEWATWPVVVAIPLLGWSWFSVAGDPYRVPFSDFAVGSLLWVSWGLHLLLRGQDRRIEKAEEEKAIETEAKGWPAVLDWLETHRQIPAPEPFEEHDAEPLQLTDADLRTAGVLSPLVRDLLPEPRKLTVQQRVVLTQLALQGYVHVDPPVTLDRLSLGTDVPDIRENRSGQRSRHQIVLAPEGSGKTTLALLAAANHALVHTRATLVVVRDEESAKRTAERFRRVLEPSPLRWNVRVRHPGADLMNDLSQGIAPDVVVCGLNDLVVTLLDRIDTFAPFLRNLGLIVVDDVESFAGSVEVHAQLAFRRLILRVGELLGVDELGDKEEESRPQVLVLGAESMHEMPKWVRALCGIDAIVRTFSRPAQEAGEREKAALAASGIAVAGDSAEEAPTRSPVAGEAPARHLFYRLRDFRTPAGESLVLEDFVATCERLAVPWHYRLCGDGRRELGRGPLLLREEPLHFTGVPEEACVVVLEGTWSEVRRERRRLVRAGARFSRFRHPGGEMVRHGGAPLEPIAFITVVDPDLEMSLTQLDKSFALAPALESLPRPVLRPPTGLAVGPHLSADLSHHWMEVADLLTVFGVATAATLRSLADGGLLLCEPQVDVEERANEYSEKLYVRALARAIQGSGEKDPISQRQSGHSPLLPPKVVQVELTAQAVIAVRNRVDLVSLGWADEANGHLVYYPGRIFKDARGTFVVAGRAGEEDDRGDVLVEPLLADEVSSPRRRLLIESLRGKEAAQDLLDAAGGSFPDSNLVLIGRSPFGLALEPVEVRVAHVATFRLGPVHGEIRQRALLDPDTRTRYLARPLPTVALALFPNPAGSAQAASGTAPEASNPAPRLTVVQARVLAAVVRALFPAIYRGGGEGVIVALHLDETAGWEADRPLGPHEGLFLLDADFRGNGTARAVFRDGVELLLRLARLAVERTLSLARLRALHDEWGDEAEILAEGEVLPAGGEIDEAAPDHSLRAGLLEWLDSRLLPEGGLEAAAAAAGARQGAEPGEGDAFDFGRCWFSRDDAFRDLVWVKHRWRLPQKGEAMLDIAFDRRTETTARSGFDTTKLVLGQEAYDALRANPLTRLADGTSRHEPRGVRFLVPVQRETRTAEELDRERLCVLHRQAVALGSAAAPLLKPLAAVLLERRPDAAGLPGPLGTISWLAAFVQGIPFSVGGAGQSAIPHPVSTLLLRSGDGRAKSLLLAVLLRHAGIAAGLFHSFAEDCTFAAAALPDAMPEGGDVTSRLEAWSRAAGLPSPPPFWAELPGRSGVEIFVPIPVRSHTGPGAVQVEQPATWAFLPLLLPEALPDVETHAELTAFDEAAHERHA